MAWQHQVCGAVSLFASRSAALTRHGRAGSSTYSIAPFTQRVTTNSLIRRGASEGSHRPRTLPDGERPQTSFTLVSGSPADSPGPVRTPCPWLEVKGSPVQSGRPDEFFECLYLELGTKTAMIVPTCVRRHEQSIHGGDYTVLLTAGTTTAEIPRPPQAAEEICRYGRRGWVARQGRKHGSPLAAGGQLADDAQITMGLPPPWISGRSTRCGYGSGVTDASASAFAIRGPYISA
jgi:hypothetical protein